MKRLIAWGLVCILLLTSCGQNNSVQAGQGGSASNSSANNGDYTASDALTDTPSIDEYQDPAIEEELESSETDIPDISEATLPNAEAEGTTPNTPGQIYTDIPTTLLQEGWAAFAGTLEYCPKFEFYPDGQFNMWINLAHEYVKETSTFEVYQYSGGLRAIACDVSTVAPYENIYLLETEEGTWDYYGTSAGFTDINSCFTSADSSTVSAPAISVQDPNLSTGYHWMTKGGEDELSINWVNSGKVSFGLDIYRLCGYTNQIGLCAPDGAVYCFLNGADGRDVSSQPDGLVRLTFQADSISLEFLSATDSEHVYWRDYVGQTYIFR